MTRYFKVTTSKNRTINITIQDIERLNCIIGNARDDDEEILEIVEIFKKEG